MQLNIIFRKREKNFDDALVYGIMSYLEDLNYAHSSLKYDEVKKKKLKEILEEDYESDKSPAYWSERLKHLTSDDFISETIKKKLKKTNYEDKFKDIFNLVKGYTKEIPKNNFSIIEDLEKLKK